MDESAATMVRWDMRTGKLIKEFPVPPGIFFSRAARYTKDGAQPGLHYRGNRYVLMDNRVLIDLEGGAVLWQYLLEDGHYAQGSPNDQTWFAARKEDSRSGPMFLTSVNTPSEHVAGWGDVVKPEDQLVLYPGAEVRLSIELSGVGAPGT